MMWVHQLLGAAWTFLATSALLTGIAGVWLNRRLSSIDRPGAFDRTSVYAALVLPGLIPFIWAMSSAVHGLATGTTLSCCAWLMQSPIGWRHLLFGFVPFVLFAAQLWSFISHYRARHGTHQSPGDQSARARLRRIVRNDESLRPYARLIRLVDCSGGIFAARGSSQPRIEVASSLVERLDDDALRAALHHEVAHLRHRDPWRFGILAAARVLNPFYGWLESYASAWRFAREIRCDREATEQGAEPLALADALVTVAKQSGTAAECAESGSKFSLGYAGLCGADQTRLSVRVQLLVEKTLGDIGNDPDESGGFRATHLLALGLASVVLPHVLGRTVAFLHCLAEWPIL